MYSNFRRILFLALSIVFFQFSVSAQNKEGKKSIYDFTMKSIDGKDLSLSQYKGKFILIVNTASLCGFTPQYKGLEKLYKEYKDKLVILAFPSNDFQNQEPGTNAEIKEFCTNEYNVSFQMFEKIDVIGKNQNPFYAYLEAQTGKKPTWNFSKYLISPEGKIISFFGPKVKPLDAKITSVLSASNEH